MGRVAGKVALVTGGASGLGRADCELLAREGASVILTDIDAAAGEAAAEAIRASGGEVEFRRLDVTSPEDWQAAVDYVRERHGRLNVLVNNAGIAKSETIEQCTLESYRRQNAIMNEGVFLGCKTALPLLKDSGNGSIINMSSIASHMGYPVFFAYSAAKGAVRSLTKALAVHCQMHGYPVRANSLHPGAIDTPMIDQTAAELGLADKAEVSPVVGLGKPEDVANAVLFLASDESRFINGVELLIDNALSIQ
ncbi:MAG: SDR family oxidoreductase [Gammaproteobacteria bacterium]|nr:MAG: SDR family oxidoreductase [Gammaproteobacteria bacterium]